MAKTDWAAIFKSAPKAKPNNPSMAGKNASKIEMGGDFCRYALYAVHTRFDAVTWFIRDAEVRDVETGRSAIVYQGDCPL